MIYYITLRKESLHTVTIRVEAIDRVNAEAKARGLAERNPGDWDSVVEGEPEVVSVAESDDASA